MHALHRSGAPLTHCPLFAKHSCTSHSWLARKPLLTGTRRRSQVLAARRSRHELLEHPGNRPSPETLLEGYALGSGPKPTAQGAENEIEAAEQPEVNPYLPPIDRPPLGPPQPKEQLYERKYGLPIVGRKLNYGQLLQEIRLGNVKAIKHFGRQQDEQTRLALEHCLVVFKDGSLAQSYVPLEDYRVAYAIQNHDVKTTILEGPPPVPPSFLNARINASQFKIATFLAPIVAILGVYGLVQFVEWQKVDKAERDRMRNVDIEAEIRDKEQAKKDMILMEPVQWAEAGMSVDDILAMFSVKKGDAPTPSRQYIEKIVARAKRKAEGQQEALRQEREEAANLEPTPEGSIISAANRDQKQEQSGIEEQDDGAEGEKKEFTKSGYVKINRQSLDPESEQLRMAELRKTQRQMKGIKLQNTADQQVFFDDIAGVAEAKYEMQEVVDFFLKPARFNKSGARQPRGVLMAGPPGCGKTLLARAVAGECGVNFLSMVASEFVEMFAGLGAARIREVFQQARAVAPVIIFIDEIDAIGAARSGNSGNDERDQTLNQLLVEMDGFKTETGVIVIAATNRAEMLDKALIRPGRFDRIIDVRPSRDPDSIMELFKVHLDKQGDKLGESITDANVRTFVGSQGATTGANVANLINLALTASERAGRRTLEMDDIYTAQKEINRGFDLPPLTKERQRRVAIWECSKALVASLLPAIEEVRYINIQPTEKIPLGQTVLTANDQREKNDLWTRGYMTQQLRLVLADRAAEEMYYGRDGMSTMNAKGITFARRIVQKMVITAGMHDSDIIGPRTISSHEMDEITWQIIDDRMSLRTHRAAEEQMQQMLNEACSDVKGMVMRNRDALDALIEALIQSPDQNLEGSEIRDIIRRRGHPADVQHKEANTAAFA